MNRKSQIVTGESGIRLEMCLGRSDVGHRRDNDTTGTPIKMQVQPKMIALSLIGLCVAAIALLGGCAPKAVRQDNVLDSPQQHVHNGMKFLTLGKYGNAFREFELSKEFDPTFSKAYVGSGLVWGHRGDYKRGLQEIQKAKDLANTDEEKAFANVGLIRFFVIGKGSAFDKWLQEAESAYKDAVALLPDSSEAHYYMGEAYKEASKFQKARERFKKVLEINNTHVMKQGVA